MKKHSEEHSETRKITVSEGIRLSKRNGLSYFLEGAGSILDISGSSFTLNSPYSVPTIEEINQNLEKPTWEILAGDWQTLAGDWQVLADDWNTVGSNFTELLEEEK